MLDGSLVEQTHHQRPGVPTAGDEAAEHGPRRRLFVEVERLRVELPGKGDNFVFGDRVVAEVDDVADLEIVEVAGWDRRRTAHDTAGSGVAEGVRRAWIGSSRMAMAMPVARKAKNAADTKAAL